jgi:hypothetical protein
MITGDSPDGPDIQTLEDPRPVFDGDWSKADGRARQAHMTRVAAWKARHPELDHRPAGKGRKAASSDLRSEAGSQDEEHAARSKHLATLEAIVHEPGALASDRIRAIEARERILSKQAEEKALEAHGPLIALGEALRAIPTDQRVEALAGLLRVEG